MGKPKRKVKRFGKIRHWKRLEYLAKPAKVRSRSVSPDEKFKVKKSALNYKPSLRIIELAKPVEKKDPEIVIEKPPVHPPYRRFSISIDIAEIGELKDSFAIKIPVKILTTFHNLPPRIDEISKPVRVRAKFKPQ